MKNIKITKENYKELFECAGFEKESDNEADLKTFFNICL